MRRWSPLLVATLSIGAAAKAPAAPPVVLAREGWTVTADADQGLITVANDRLGPVLEKVRLGAAGVRPWTSFSVEAEGPGKLRIRTTAPISAWRFETDGDALRIATTARGAALTGEAPAPADRIVARLLDPAGTPVDWVGTDEVKNGFGGSDTRNRSYLPARNPDAMYFSLGPVAATTLHSLFDRKTDTAVRFPEDARLERDPANAARLLVSIPVARSAVVRVFPDYFVKTLGVPYYVPFDDSRFGRPPTIWCSWTSYYADVTEDDIVRNADWLGDNLKDYGFDYVQLDDGYDRGPNGEHYWIERWDTAKFPHGPEWLTAHVKSRGLRPGLWLVPNAYAGAVDAHPDWYVRDAQGRAIRDYNTPALDSSNPEALDFVRKMFTTLRGWGFEYYKFDGEHALPRYVPALDKGRLHDPTADPLDVYRKRLGVIREAIGPETFVEGCPAGTPLNGIGYFNSYFDGDDVYNNWAGMFALFSSINANAFWNHLVAYVMPGEGIEVGPPMTVAEAEKKRPRSFVETGRSREEPLAGFGTTMAEARTLVTYLSLTGVAYPLASVMPELPPDRVALLKSTLPTLPILPVDLFSRGTDMQWGKFKGLRPDDYIHDYPEVLDLKVNAVPGTYDVVGLTNWRGAPASRELSLDATLGLPRGTRAVVFDYWQRKLLGVFTDVVRVDVEPHDTRVLLVHPLQPRPQLVGISRHLTAVPSLVSLDWDAARHALRGSSQAVAGEEYALYVHVPRGAAVAAVKATVGGATLPVRQERAGELLTVTFRGPAGPVAWEVAFKPGGGRTAASRPTAAARPRVEAPPEAAGRPSPRP
jgi:hypothetical protein